MKFSFVLITVILFLFSCNYANKTQADLESSDIQLEKLEEKADTIAFQTPRQPSFQQTPGKQQPAIVKDWDKKIIKTATLNAEVKDLQTFSKALSEKVKAFGGYIVSEQQSGSDYKIESNVSIKIPVAQFDAAVSDLLKDASRVDGKQISSEDVSSEYIDSKSRLEAKKQIRLRYLELLKVAKNMSDIIEVQKEINEIQEEIEMVSGRINYLGHSAAMSTINYNYYQILDPSAKDTGNVNFLSEFSDAFSKGWYWLGEILISLISVWPLILLGGVSIILLRKKQLIRIK
jgi:hypothetical protein